MAFQNKPLNEILTFSRASGATRVNAAGLIVGVDFSTTSNTITTGSKTFTLTADLNVNRDWAVGSSVIAVAQAGATGSMTGTVTSYTPSTQALVINVASVTGSGTSSDWRIGSLEIRRDFDPVTLQPKGLLVEGQETNANARSQVFSDALWTKSNSTVAPNAAISPSGSNDAWKLNDNATNSLHGIQYNTVFGIGPVTTYFIVKAAEYGFCKVGATDLTTGDVTVDFNITTGASVAQANGGSWGAPTPISRPLGNGYYLVGFTAQKGAGSSYSTYLYVAPTAATFTFSGTGTSGIFVYAAQFCNNTTAATSYIPTTIAQVTRAADLPNIDGSRFTQAYNPSQGTLLVECTPIASAVQSVALSINDGTTNNAIRIAQKQSGTLSSIRKMATDGVTDVMAINASTGNTLRSNGIDYDEISDQSAVAKFGVASSGIGQFLNVGGTENFRSSADSGATYNARTIGGTFAGAHFGIGRFVIAGSTATINGATVGSVIVSPDGLAFRRINIPGLTQNLNEVTSNGTNQYVAVGNGGVIYTSPDAETWTARTSGQPVGNPLNAVTFSGTRYVAFASNGTAANTVSYSDDGITWLTANPGGNFSGLDVHFANGIYVAVGQDGGNTSGTIRTSPDGITWTLRFTAASTGTTLRGVHFADNLWVAVGNTGTVVTSPDGITWTDRTATSGTTATIHEVGFFGGKFYYVGVNQMIYENTAAGIVAGTTWVLRSSTLAGTTLLGIATNGSRLLVCGSAGGIATSEDGVTFTSRTGNGQTLNGATFGNGTYVIVGSALNGSGLIATVNPTTFEYQRRVSQTVGSFQSCRFLGGLFLAASSNSRISYSSNGADWTLSLFGGVSTDVQDTAYNGTNIFIAVCSGGRVATSSDGITWTNANLTGVTTQNLFGAFFANGLFVAVGNAGTIITSPNGTTWTLRTSGTTVNLFSVMYSTRDQQWYAAGDAGTILRSADAITWENISNDAIGAVIRTGRIQANPALPNLIPNQVNKVAMRIRANDVAVSVNGASVVKDTQAILPAGLTQLSLGMNGLQGNSFNGWIRDVQVFTSLKDDAFLVSKSTL